MTREIVKFQCKTLGLRFKAHSAQFQHIPVAVSFLSLSLFHKPPYLPVYRSACVCKRLLYLNIFWHSSSLTVNVSVMRQCEGKHGPPPLRYSFAWRKSFSNSKYYTTCFYIVHVPRAPWDTAIADRFSFLGKPTSTLDSQYFSRNFPSKMAPFPEALPWIKLK